MKLSNEILASLVCPRCGQGPLTAKGNGLKCGACQETFPELGGLPCLVPEYSRFLTDWKAQTESFLAQLQTEEEGLRAEAAAPGMLPSTRQRLTAVAQAKADQRETFSRLLGAVLKSPPIPRDLLLSLPPRKHASASLLTYSSNLFRDWSWGEAENAASLQAVMRVIAASPPKGQEKGLAVVLGAGAGRLAYDLHCNQWAAQTVALDINPLLLLAGARIARGETLSFVEFPLSPVDSASTAVKRACAAPAAAAPGLHFVFADGIQPPFRAGSVDTVATPWFIDILPEDARVLIPRLNRMLRPDGRWIFHGSLAFAHPRAGSCYSWEELQEIIAASGFKIEKQSRDLLPYLQSPASCFQRSEKVLSFSARKVGEVAAEEFSPPGTDGRIPWLADPALPVPLLPEFENVTKVGKVVSDILVWVDGKRSIADLIPLFSQKFAVDAETAQGMLKTFLRDFLGRK